MSVQNHSEIIRKDGILGQDDKACFPTESKLAQNGYCRTHVIDDAKINGLKMNGHCVSARENGHVKNKHCMLVNRNGHLVKNGYEKNGEWKLVGDGVIRNGHRENGYCGLVRRCQKDRHAFKAGSTVAEETSSTEEQCSKETTSSDEVPRALEAAQSSHIKVCFHALL